MKIVLALVLVLASSIATAKDFAYIKNEGGGVIMLTDEPCSMDNKYLRVWNNLLSGAAEEGCYKIFWESGMVRVYWSDGSKYTYRAADFTTVKNAPPGYLR